MIERFLAYSLRWNCPVKLVYMKEGQMVSGNVTVVALKGDSFDFVTARKKTKPQTLMVSDVMAASYARGDDGDTLKKMQQQKEQGEIDQ
ncbi:MAG: hypothetical protein GX611_09375 [Clostridiales bacterium]|nr:hypothetical protein [Clostridiales bacterium]